MINPQGDDRFTPLSIGKLYAWIKNEIKQEGSIFGIPKDFFFKPSLEDNFRIKRFGKLLETPVGLAAGPHTQLAQNIISGWLCGARYIELKTVQELDEIEVSKPCIDMRDEGYNCEWSQELKIDESFKEYLKAWILLHYLRHDLDLGSSVESGFIFNMSTGYDLSGIKGRKVSDFLKNMGNSREFKKDMIEELTQQFPTISELTIPDKISDNITISTMHGTPPEEIEKIGKYFLEDIGLHTIVKLNPTLLGPKKVREILNKNLGFNTIVPDSAFNHDIKYEEALKLTANLKEIASKRGLFFGLKLTNTLECLNSENIFQKKETMAYMSGKALHPISVNIASTFRNDTKGNINISFSAGADTFNIPNLIACDLMPVTVSSDILKPGGYSRINQYLKNISDSVSESGSKNINEFIGNKVSALKNLTSYAKKTINSKSFEKEGFKNKNTKTDRKLHLFDCIGAPCINSCATSQNVPQYLYLTSKGKFTEAFNTVIKTNPMPNTTGMVCDHKCQSKCTRSNYDNPLKIREIKKFLSENYGNDFEYIEKRLRKGTGTVAIIGAGPSGLSCAGYLYDAGFLVTIYERKSVAGGMIESVIPEFRLGKESLNKDIKRIYSRKIKTIYNKNIDPDDLKKIAKKNDYVYLSTGAPKSIKLKIENIESVGVLDPIEFLSAVKQGKKVNIGNRIAIIGGGNTAIDSARVALRMSQNNSEVTILYRRTKKEMPAECDELITAINEGVKIIELIAPEKILIDNSGKVIGLQCSKTRLGKPGREGRRYPIKIDDSEEDLEFDTIIPAIGQRTEPYLFDKSVLNLKKEGRLLRDGNIIVGGDAGISTSTIINAVGDGRVAAELIIRENGISPPKNNKPLINRETPIVDLREKRTKRIFGQPLNKLSPEHIMGSNLRVLTMTKEEAITESSRCLLCDELCDICVTVCPNRANISYSSSPLSINIPIFKKKTEGIELVGEKKFSTFQNQQVVNIVDFCNHCGNCTTFCPSSGRPFMDKPRISLSKKSFEKNKNIFGIFIKENVKYIALKIEEEYIELYFEKKDIFHLASKLYSLTFNKNNLKIDSISFGKGAKPIPDMVRVATARHLLKNIPDYLFKIGEPIRVPFCH